MEERIEAKITRLMNAAEKGDAEAAGRLGDLYRLGEGVTQSWREAFRWYKLAATQGDKDAQNNVGSCYLEGLGCRRNLAEAIRWYEQSAAQGNADAQYNLGKRHLHGDGVPIDYQAAARWFAAAAEQGIMEALCDLGTMHRFGHGVERNLVAAADMHVTAALEGDAVAVGNLADYREELEEIALAGNQIASLCLAKVYDRGLAVEKDQATMFAWLLWAMKDCAPDQEGSYADEVRERYDFYKSALPREIIRLGKAQYLAFKKRRS